MRHGPCNIIFPATDETSTTRERRDETGSAMGSGDENSKQIVWSVGQHGQMIFQANLEQLLGSQAPVEAHFANGQSNRWTATKVQPPPNARD